MLVKAENNKFHQEKPAFLEFLHIDINVDEYGEYRNNRSFSNISLQTDRLCGLVVRVTGYRSRGPGFVSRRYQVFWEVVGLERGSLSLVRITEVLLERKVAAPI
jgi:hypothetical protein